MKEINPPGDIPTARPLLFLAGSIEMGAAEDWQTVVVKRLKGSPWVILNPRRKEWDSSWEQSIHNKVFREQVEWELEAQEKADLIIMYFDPATKSPITLLELGLFANSGKLFVVCPDGFWRKGNIDIVCDRYGIPQFPSLSKLLDFLPNGGGENV